MKTSYFNIGFLITACCISLTIPSLHANIDIIEVVTDQAPKAIGPYSQGIRAGNLIFISGQIGVDPTTGKFAGDTIEDQTKQVLKNLEAILLSQGLTLGDVVKTEVYLKDLKDFQVMNSVYAEKFSYAVKPARATIQVTKIPLDALLEISCIAFISGQ